jgi:hypothetical protein
MEQRQHAWTCATVSACPSSIVQRSEHKVPSHPVSLYGSIREQTGRWICQACWWAASLGAVAGAGAAAAAAAAAAASDALESCHRLYQRASRALWAHIVRIQHLRVPHPAAARTVMSYKDQARVGPHNFAHVAAKGSWCGPLFGRRAVFEALMHAVTRCPSVTGAARAEARCEWLRADASRHLQQRQHAITPVPMPWLVRQPRSVARSGYYKQQQLLPPPPPPPKVNMWCAWPFPVPTE